MMVLVGLFFFFFFPEVMVIVFVLDTNGMCKLVVCC